MTYTACANDAEAESRGLGTAGEATGSTRGFWVGGFLLRDRDSACLPLEITVGDDPTVHRVDLALPVGACG